MTIDFTSVVKLLYPLLVAVNGMLPATVSPAVKMLLALAIRVLGQFAGQASIPVAGVEHAHLFGVHAPVEAPPEEQWTPEGLAKFAREHSS